jgi:transposase-like protein
MRSKRSGRLEAKWREIVAGHPVSGQTIRAYCKARQVNEASFFYWRRELERRAQPVEVRPQMIPIRILPEPSLLVQVRCPSGHVVRLSSRDGSLLSNLFRALNGGGAC